jgi:hypothetical protein
MTTEKKFARKCSVSGKGMNKGYVINDGDMYIKERTDLINHFRTLEWIDADGLNSKDIRNESALEEFFYNQEYYYYTEWDVFDDDRYYTESGEEVTNE